jgi:serine/threonine protein kinase
MGAVYKARQRELDRIVALKIFPPGIGGDTAFAERFTREAKALARLNHPGIVTIHDFGRADGLYFFVMEFVDGVNLRQLLAGGRVSPREALAIVPEICDALQYAHDQGIVHRDIKPENILLDRRGRVKVTDFGLAKIVAADAPSLGGAGAANSGERACAPAALSDKGKVLGTPAYMAPEQVKHPDDVDHRADIYALGVVFYQMLTGELPGQRIEPPTKKIQIDVRLDEVVLRALEKRPERRYQQVSEVKTKVETIATTMSEPIAPQPHPEISTQSWLKLKQHSTFTPPAGPVELKLKWPPGARIVEEMDMKQDMEIHKPGQPDPVKQELSMRNQHGFKVLKETPDGGHEVELEFLSARMGMVIGSYSWLYDSTKQSPADTSEVAEIFGNIVGSKIQYFLDAGNAVERMEWVDALLKRLKFSVGATVKPGTAWNKKALDAVVSRLTSGSQPSSFDWLRNMFTEAYFKSLIIHYFLPANPVQPGDIWPVLHEFPTTTGTLVRKFNVTFRSWEMHENRHCARLEFEGVETSKLGPNSKPPGITSMDGTYSGVAWFDPGLGRVIEANSSRDFKVMTNYSVNPQKDPNAAGPLPSIPDQHHQVIIEKLVSVEGLG